jgi:ribose 5-phosphate isomerase B
MVIAIGSDHGGFRLKTRIIAHFTDLQFDDVGTDAMESCDYSDYARLVAERVVRGHAQRGIVICGSGLGVSIAANKIRGIRAALCCNEYMAEMSRRHNDANILALGERVLGEELALSIVKRWLETPFDGGRHQRRIDKVMSLEHADNKHS